MKILIATLMLIQTSMLYSSELLHQCSMKAQYLGDSKNPESISKECYDEIMKNKNAKNFDQSKLDTPKETSVFSIGFKNILYNAYFPIDEKENNKLTSLHLISGKQSKLSNIIAVEVNPADQRVYVLNDSNDRKSVVSFQLDLSGNIAPRRELSSSELDHASNLKIDHDDQTLYVVSQEEGWIKGFNLYADVNGKRSEHSVEVKKKLQGPPAGILAPLDLAINNSGPKLYVLEEGKIIVFNKNINENSKPIQIFNDMNQLPEGLETIDYNKDFNQITVKDSHQIIYKYLLDENGLIKKRDD